MKSNSNIEEANQRGSELLAHSPRAVSTRYDCPGWDGPGGRVRKLVPAEAASQPEGWPTKRQGDRNSFECCYTLNPVRLPVSKPGPAEC
jgi:hypothetical protein